MDDAWEKLLRLKKLASEYQAFNREALQFLFKAHEIDEETRSHLKKRAEEVRVLSEQVPEPLARQMLLELADCYEQLAN